MGLQTMLREGGVVLLMVLQCGAVFWGNLERRCSEKLGVLQGDALVRLTEYVMEAHSRH